jgi:alkanesulfonate monooxygenase SsuD/methylene tetrahydromethanopterin reductase-like flavin-dependent oxidoreductase (luciferase family)
MAAGGTSAAGRGRVLLSASETAPEGQARVAVLRQGLQSWGRARAATSRSTSAGPAGDDLDGSEGEEAAALYAAAVHASRMLWFFSGNDRTRCPVAAKIALSTAGAATKIVGSPTPPQNPPDGMMMHSTFGIALIRIES